MPSDKIKSLENKIQKLKTEICSIKEQNASLRSENTALQRSKKWSDDLLASNPTGIIILQQGKITYINRTMVDQLGYETEEIIDRKFLDFLHPDYTKIETGLYKKLFAGKKTPVQHETHLATSEGHAICCDTRINIARMKGRKVYILNFTRAEIRKEREREKVISVKKEALKTMALGIGYKLDRCIEEIILSVGDLRTTEASGDSNIRKNLADIINAAYKTRQISAKLNLLSTEKTNREDWKLILISQVVKDAVLETMENWNVKPPSQIDLKTYLRSKSFIQGDPEKLKEVVVNMILNSVEAMPNGGEIHLTTEENAGYAHIFIQDTGEGISDQYKARVFDPFFTTRGEKGRGLGLSLCYSIIKHHKGTIEMTSNMDQGAMFEIKIPLPKIKAKKNPKSSNRKIQNTHVLLIQDEDFIRELMAQFLSNKGCKVDTVMSGVEGLGKIKKGKWDLVIADTELPDVDRKSFIKKGRMINSNLPFVLIDGHRDDQSSVDSTKPVANLILTKPLDVNIVVNQILELLTNSD